MIRVRVGSDKMVEIKIRVSFMNRTSDRVKIELPPFQP